MKPCRIAVVLCLAGATASCSKSSAPSDGGRVPPPVVEKKAETPPPPEKAPATAPAALPCENATACLSSCQPNDTGSCLRAGLFLEERGDPGAALPAFETGCQAGDARACVMLAVGPDGRERDDTPSVRSAIAKLGDDCNAGKARSCWGLALSNGLRPFTDTAKEMQRLSTAIEFARKACDHDYALACQVLGEIEEKQDPKQSDARYRKAAELFEKICMHDDAHENVGVCDRASTFYDRGLGVAKDSARVERLLERKAVLILQAACRTGVTEACRGDRSVLPDVVWGKHTKVTFWPKPACDVGILDSCWPDPPNQAAWEKATREPPPPPPPPPRPRGRRTPSPSDEAQGGVVGGQLGD